MYVWNLRQCALDLRYRIEYLSFHSYPVSYISQVYTCHISAKSTHVTYQPSLHMSYISQVYTCHISAKSTRVIYQPSLHVSYISQVYTCHISAKSTRVIYQASLHMSYISQVYTCHIQPSLHMSYISQVYTVSFVLYISDTYCTSWEMWPYTCKWMRNVTIYMNVQVRRIQNVVHV